ncbi:argininosuccinate synthase [Bartonella melophagi K-2C]|uniref:Argininosuccinate synthase n=1 Tax=Bartonella melophagi K-2C TaxID=1094557 RepID=J1K3C4_9HYPH|nr:argininosuccinate synthase [Bartonella melophagi K-2C]
MFRTNAVYEGVYLLGTSIARSLISKHLIEIAKETGADAIAHGATRKGNNQVRFELSAYALNPDIKVKDVAGFIKLNALRLGTLAMRSSKL